MDQEFDLLRRELQQHVPFPRIIAHIDALLQSHSPADFQAKFLKGVQGFKGRFPGSILARVYQCLLVRFDRINGDRRYALLDEFVEFFASENCERAHETVERVYELAEGQSLRIKASESLIRDGTTGYSLWEASVALLALLQVDRFRSLFKGKRVVELGSGTGLGGLAVAACSHPKNVLLTDVLAVHNNFTLPNRLLNPQLAHLTDTQILYWNDLEINKDFRFDTILGCDLVYDPEVVAILLSALKILLKSPSITSAIFICTLRNPQTFTDFVGEVRNISGWSVEIEEIGDCYDPQRNPVILQSIESFRIVKLNKTAV